MLPHIAVLVVLIKLPVVATAVVVVLLLLPLPGATSATLPDMSLLWSLSLTLL